MRALDDLRGRTERARKALIDEVNKYPHEAAEHARLSGKVDGVGLVLSYIDEAIRLTPAYKDPPIGWYPFGTHAGWDGVTLQMSEEVGEDLMPLWERRLSWDPEPGGLIATREPCNTPGCPGDGRYAAPGRGHDDRCRHPFTALHGL